MLGARVTIKLGCGCEAAVMQSLPDNLLVKEGTAVGLYTSLQEVLELEDVLKFIAEEHVLYHGAEELTISVKLIDMPREPDEVEDE